MRKDEFNLVSAANDIMNRNSSIELYRNGLMFNICLLYSIVLGPLKYPWLRNFLVSCVVGFMFISEWFGVKFRWWKLAKLYGAGVHAVSVFIALLAVTGSAGPLGEAAIMLSCDKLTYGLWVLQACIGMLILAPMVDALLSVVRFSRSSYSPFSTRC